MTYEELTSRRNEYLIDLSDEEIKEYWGEDNIKIIQSLQEKAKREGLVFFCHGTDLKSAKNIALLGFHVPNDELDRNGNHSITDEEFSILTGHLDFSSAIINELKRRGDLYLKKIPNSEQHVTLSFKSKRPDWDYFTHEYCIESGLGISYGYDISTTATRSNNLNLKELSSRGVRTQGDCPAMVIMMVPQKYLLNDWHDLPSQATAYRCEVGVAVKTDSNGNPDLHNISIESIKVRKVIPSQLLGAILYTKGKKVFLNPHYDSHYVEKRIEEDKQNGIEVYTGVEEIELNNRSRTQLPNHNNVIL